MPIYEYRCNNCGFEKECLQKLSDAPITLCPSCGKSEMVKQVTAAGFQLKGSGWYATDFKGSPKPAPKADDAGKQDKKDDKGDKGDKSEQAKASEQPKRSEQSGAEKSASESPSTTAPAAGTANGS
jgi:putative FmdB family regulatory protein